MSSIESAAPIPVVLDTNVVLDLWLFNDARAEPLRAALREGRLQALVTEATLAELAAVLERPFAHDRIVAPGAVPTALAGCSRMVVAPVRQAPFPPRCSDADDQKFIDLAWYGAAAWLFSRDRAVLKLARAARARRLRIGTPESWPGTVSEASPR